MIPITTTSLPSSPTPLPPSHSVPVMPSHLSVPQICQAYCLPQGLCTGLFPLPGRLFSRHLHGFLTSFKALLKCNLIKEVFLITLSEIASSHFLFPYPALFFSTHLAPNIIYLCIVFLARRV